MGIQIAVARADMLICGVGAILDAALPKLLLLGLILFAFRRL
jgi:hypothetical protein